jgi:hypothetical protein
MKEKLKTFLRFTVSTLLVVVSFYLVFVNVNFDELLKILAKADYLWVVVSIPISLMSHWVRAMRWKTMLQPMLGKRHASTWNLFSAVMIGYAVNNVIPRGGEFLRPYVYARREKISFSSSFATIVAERFIDVIVLLLLLGGVFFFFREQIIQALPNIHVQDILMPLAIVILVIALSFYPPVFKFLLKLVIKPFSQKFYERVLSIFDRFIKGFEIIKTPSKYFQLVIESLVIWLFYTIPLFLMFFTFGFDQAYNMRFDDAILLIVVSGIGTTVAPTPGAIGVYHGLITLTLTRIYDISMEEAVAYATVTHTINYLVQIIPGGFFFFRENIKKIPKRNDIVSDI